MGILYKRASVSLITMFWLITLILIGILLLQSYQLQQRLNILDNTNKQLEIKNVELYAENEKFKQEIEFLKAENEKLKQQNTGVTENLSKSTSEVKSVTNDRKIAYLTFDDGPSQNTAQILDILKQYNVKATFFVIGNNTELGKNMYRRIIEEGHAIGNHTYSHDYSKIYASVNAYISDMEKLNNLIYETTGVKPEIIRFPGGSNNHVSWQYSGKEFMKELIKQVQKDGYQYFDWNVSATDASVKTQNKQAIIDSVINGVKGKKEAIILLHDSSFKTTTVEALPVIIDELKQQGFVFETLSRDSKAIHFLESGL